MDECDIQNQIGGTGLPSREAETRHPTPDTHLLRRGGRSKRRGQALVPVIFVLLILTLLAVAFATSAHREIRASANFMAHTQEYYTARGALNYAMSALAQTSANGATYGIVPANANADANGWWQMGDAWVKIQVIDTGSCININQITLATLEQLPIFAQNPDLAQAIIDWRTASSASSGASGSSQSASSAASSTSPEAQYYSGLPMPYTPKGAPYDTVNELLLVEGMTPTILYSTMGGNPIPAGQMDGSFGMLNSANGSAPTRQAAGKPGGQTSKPGGSGASGAAGSSSAGGSATDFSSVFAASTTPMAELFTTISRERNISASGTQRVNINTASATALQNLGLSSTLAQQIVQYRQQQSATTTNTLTATLTNSVNELDLGAVQAPVGQRAAFTSRQAAGGARPTQNNTGYGAGAGAGNTAQTGNGQAGGGQNAGGGNGGGQNGTGQGGSAGGATQTFTTIADLMSKVNIPASVMQTIADQISVNNNTYRENVVNINTAPQEVLATVPGMDMTILNAILQYRQGGQTFQTLNDLFTLQGLTSQEYQAVINNLTAKTDTYYIHIKVRMPGQGSIYAVSALVELTANGPQVLQWSEVPRSPGWSTWMTPPNLPTPTPPTTSGSSSGSSSTTGTGGQ